MKNIRDENFELGDRVFFINNGIQVEIKALLPDHEPVAIAKVERPDGRTYYDQFPLRKLSHTAPKMQGVCIFNDENYLILNEEY